MRHQDHIVLKGLKISCIIGIFDWERKRKQQVLIDLKFPCDIRKASRRDSIHDAVDYKKIAKSTIAFVESSRFQLVETLAESLAKHLLDGFPIAEIQINVSKPGAIRGSQNVGVEILRVNPQKKWDTSYLSLGSNINPAIHLGNALKALDQKYGLQACSHIYETSPVGGRKNQAPFWNMAVAAKIEEAPQTIKKWISTLEKKEGRTKKINRYAARTLDVDLLLWGDRLVQDKGLELPHPDIKQKAFVLFPLLEIAPTLVLPGFGKPLMEIASTFRDKTQKIRRLPLNLFRH